MTISRRQPLLYYLLLIILLQWSTRLVDGAVLYNNDNYVDAFYQDANYYDTFANPGYDVGTSDAEQGRIDNVQVEEGEVEPVQQLDSLQTGAEAEQDAREQNRLSEIEKAEQLGMTDEEATHPKREINDNYYSQRYGQEQKSAYVCHGQTPEQQARLDAAVKDTKDTIEHVTLLIKRMREHAVAIVKEINELEGDFLGACQDERSKVANPKRPPENKASCKELFGPRGENTSGVGYNDGTGGFKRIDTERENNNNQNKLIYVSNNNRNDNDNSNDNENTNNPAPSNGQRGDYSNSGNNQNVNSNTNPKSNSTGARTKARILINEFGIPIISDTSDLPPNEFLEQAQFAVHAWKNQIEECKRLLDEQISRAAQQQPNDSVDGPKANVQHIIKIIKTPEEVEELREDDVAPSAAALITSVRSTKENSNSVNNNNNNYFNDDNPTALKARNGDKNDNRLAVSGDSTKALSGDNKNDADSDANESTNNKRNEDTKKCRRDKDKKHRAIPPLLSVLQGMGF